MGEEGRDRMTGKKKKKKLSDLIEVMFQIKFISTHKREPPKNNFLWSERKFSMVRSRRNSYISAS